VGDQGRTRVQGRKADGRRDDYAKLILILMSCHERKRQRVIQTEGGRSHLLAFLVGQTPLFCPHYMSGDRPVWDDAPFLPRLVIIALMFIPRKVIRSNDVTRTLSVTMIRHSNSLWFRLWQDNKTAFRGPAEIIRTIGVFEFTNNFKDRV